jgi:hypothetical protein
MLRLISMSAVGGLALAGAMIAPRTATGATSTELADNEAGTCGGISAEGRTEGPFLQPEAITSIEPLVIEDYPRSNPPIHRMVGAVVMVRSSPGVTAEWLQRLADCNAAHSAALSKSGQQTPDSPLDLPRVVTTVSSTSDGFRVEMQSYDPKTAREILSRSQRLYDQPRVATRSGEVISSPIRH